jgi:hypothetical protein
MRDASSSGQIVFGRDGSRKLMATEGVIEVMAAVCRTEAPNSNHQAPEKHQASGSKTQRYSLELEA